VSISTCIQDSLASKKLEGSLAVPDSMHFLIACMVLRQGKDNNFFFKEISFLRLSILFFLSKIHEKYIVPISLLLSRYSRHKKNINKTITQLKIE
jgi:hypothetical protein